jgi:hypothetical protein
MGGDDLVLLNLVDEEALARHRSVENTSARRKKA